MPTTGDTAAIAIRTKNWTTRWEGHVWARRTARRSRTYSSRDRRIHFNVQSVNMAEWRVELMLNVAFIRTDCSTGRPLSFVASAELSVGVFLGHTNGLSVGQTNGQCLWGYGRVPDVACVVWTFADDSGVDTSKMAQNMAFAVACIVATVAIRSVVVNLFGELFRCWRW